MKYILKKDLPLAKAGTEVVVVNNSIIGVDNDNVLAEIRQDLIPEWLEEVKEVKTIYDLKEGDEYWYLNEYNEVNSKGFGGCWSDSATTKCFVTELEAKRNKLLRQLATRTDKWLPLEGEKYIDFYDSTDIWYGNNYDILIYHLGLIFKDKEEYNKYMTEEVRDLLFNI